MRAQKTTLVFFFDVIFLCQDDFHCRVSNLRHMNNNNNKFFRNTVLEIHDVRLFIHILPLVSYALGSRKLISVSHRAGYPKKVRKIKDTRRHKRQRYLYKTGMPLWPINESEYEATLPGKFLVDEVGCNICHCRLHRGTLLARKCNIYANNN